MTQVIVLPHVELCPDGAVIETWGSTANPQGAIRRRILSLLP